MEPLEFLQEQFRETGISLPMQEAAFLAEFAKRYHEHQVKESKQKKNRAAKVAQAQEYLTNLQFGVWYRFGEIPIDLFDEVFNLIDERFRGWVYYFDDFDEAFKKELTWIKSSNREPYKSQRLATFEMSNLKRYHDEMFKRSSG